MKYRDVIRIIEANGFVLTRHHGTSHRQYHGKIGGQVRYVTIACHSTGDDVKPKALASIIGSPACPKSCSARTALGDKPGVARKSKNPGYALKFRSSPVQQSA